MIPRHLLAAARSGAHPRMTLMLEVVNASAVLALLGATAAGASPRANGLPRAPPAADGILAPVGPRAPARDEPFAVVISVHVSDPGADVGRYLQGLRITLRSANDLSLARVPPFPSQRSSVCCAWCTLNA